ncbi:hypothetical protein VTN77DRAFT_3150 [Rasamsonia byssochlamydoides]|uniref:uncharacterized protein n=1 Tax=Rasamsonia byssochlamydoides TaxID=89139 RepID=UPI00374234F8
MKPQLPLTCPLAVPLLLGSAASAFECSPTAFARYLPSNATVTFAYTVPENGTFTVPASDIAYPTSPTQLRELCAVQVNVTSSATSAFSFGLFLPTAWNHRFLAVGNGGFAGGINWLDMGAGVGYGFAAMSTDTGHNSSIFDGPWALHAEEKLVDWGWRAMHGSIIIAKQLTEAYYGDSLQYSYYSGCSTGGRQGLKEAEMFPDDFDGILAGSPAWWTRRLQPWTVKAGLYNGPAGASHSIPESLFPIISDEVVKQCDPQDGVKDSIIQDPHRCRLRLEALLCQGSETTNCLTADQLDTLYEIYSPYVDINQTFVFPPVLPGSESQWAVVIGNGTPNSLGTDYIRYFLQLGADWSPDEFDYSIVELADQLDPGNATADDFDLSPFYRRGGKLLQYHGMSDSLIPTYSSLYFYNQVVKTLAPKGIDLDRFYRFFYVPGMQHCSGTPSNMNAPWYFAGPNQAGALSTSIHSVPGFSDASHDVLLALMAWVENGTAPTQIIATKWHNDTLQDKVLRQRPLCMYPNQAVYVGSDDVNSAENWRCEPLY